MAAPSGNDDIARPRKLTLGLALVAAFVSLPILAVTLLLAGEIRSSIAFDRLERDGLKHVAALARVFHDANDLRIAQTCGLTTDVTPARVDRDIAAMDALEARRPLAAERWSGTARAWREGPPAARAQALSRRAERLFAPLADAARLTYDPDAAGIQLADALTYRLPSAIYQLGEAQRSTCDASTIWIPARLARYGGAADVYLRDGLGDVRDGISLDPRLDTPLSAHLAGASAASGAADAAIARAETARRPVVSPVRHTLAAAVSQLEALSDTIRPALGAIVSQRLQEREKRFRYTLLPGIFGMLAAALIVFFGGRIALQRVELTRVRRSAEELRHTATHDALTGLSNRSAFVAELERVTTEVRASGGAAAVLFIDLDNFKLVNDSLGHAAGDVVLSAVAKRLDEVARAVGARLVARFGGDEFAMLVDDPVTGAMQARVEAGAAHINTRLAQPIVVEADTSNELIVTASVGIANIDRTAVDAAAGVLRDADAAMYEAKGSGRARSAVFGAAMHERANEKLRLAGELRAALARDEFRLAYEPIVRLETQTPTAFEGLVRWQHPERGYLMPGAFLPLAEETGAITLIDRWVLREAIRALAAAQPEAGIVHVNVAARDLGEDAFVHDVAALLHEYRVSPALLALEITETSLIKSGERAERTIASLRERGVRVWLDDFGVEYSSLRYLHRLTVDGLKIDRSFVGGTNGELAAPAIVRMLLELANSLGLDVIAEGIETAAQRDALCELGCLRGQGYLFAAMAKQPAASVSLA